MTAMKHVPDSALTVQSADTGCRWGGPSCLACRLPACVHELTKEQRFKFYRHVRGIVQSAPQSHEASIPEALDPEHV